MVYGCGCAMVDKPNCFTTYAKIRFFWIPLSTMNCSREPVTHIWEWNIRSSSFESSGYSFWIFMVAMVALGSTSIIFLPLSLDYPIKISKSLDLPHGLRITPKIFNSTLISNMRIFYFPGFLRRFLAIITS